MAANLKSGSDRTTPDRSSSIKLVGAGASIRQNMLDQDFAVGEVEHLRAELANLRARYDSVVDAAPLGIITLAATGFIEHANIYAETMLGGTRLVNQRMGRFVQQNCVAAFETAMDSVLDRGEPHVCELTVVSRPNGPIHCQANFARMEWSGEPKVVVTLIDRTPVTDSLQLATRAKADLRALILRSVHPMVVLGLDGRIRLGNDRMGDLLAAVPGALEGEALELWIVEGSRNAFREHLYRRGSTPLTVDVVRRSEARRVRIQMVPVDWQHEPCVVATLDDVTDHERRVSRDEREGRLASLGLLVAGVAHEVNNPLAFVLPNVSQVAQSLRKLEPSRVVGELTAADAHEMLTEAEQGLERIAKITRDLKGFHTTDEQVEALSLNEVVIDTLRLAESQLRQNASVRRDLGALPTLQANRGRLGQVVLNLLINAAEAMPDRPQPENKIVVRTWLEFGVIHLEVRDNGKGIAQQHLANLFEPFFTTRPAGTGLGLAICANIVRDMGGWIEVSSEVGVGTRFLLCFPLGPGEGMPRRVLVVSEEPLMIKSSERHSRRYAIIQACGGFEAIRLLQRDVTVDAVVSARIMRDGSGDDLRDWVSKHRPDLAARFVFLEDELDATGPASIGDASTVSKPLTGAALQALLDQMVT